MTIDEYFGDWSNVIDKSELYKIIRWLKTVDQSLLCPTINNIFKAFRLCPYSRCKVIFLGQDQRSNVKNLYCGSKSFVLRIKSYIFTLI